MIRTTISGHLVARHMRHGSFARPSKTSSFYVAGPYSGKDAEVGLPFRLRGS